jgi:hypothetical protein
MPTDRPRSAWVIEWVWLSEHRKVKTKLLHVLNPRLNARTVINYMKCLYLNSELTSGVDRLGFLSSKHWKGRVIQEGPRISVGRNPYLMGWHVKDLTIEIDYKRSLEVFRWTEVPGRRYNEKTHEWEDLGEALTREESLPFG